ncbi:MAG: DUF4157 domain-containing protein [Blastocatellales bacterium]
MNKFKRPKPAAQRVNGRRLTALRRSRLTMDFLRRLGLVAGVPKRRGLGRSTFRQRSWPLIRKPVAAESAALETEDDFLAEPFAVAPDLSVDPPADTQESEIEPMATPPIEDATNDPQQISVTDHPAQSLESSVTAMPQSERLKEKIYGRGLSQEMGESLPATHFSRSPEIVESSILQTQSPIASEKGIEPEEPQMLFVSRGQDRSPRAWAARLLQSMDSQGVPIKQAGQNRIADKSAQGATGQRKSGTFVPAAIHSTSGRKKLSPTERQFLKPLPGFYPDDITVEQGQASMDSTGNRQLDAATEAATEGERIFVKPEISQRKPGQLGLLAHEKTHAVRSKQPRFVAPVARERGETKTVLASTVMGEPAQSFVQPEPVGSASTMRLLAEEKPARSVIARVRRKAVEAARLPQQLSEQEPAAGLSGEAHVGTPHSAESWFAPEGNEADRRADSAEAQSALPESFHPSESGWVKTGGTGSVQSSSGLEAVRSGSLPSSPSSFASLHRAERGREIAEVPARLNAMSPFGKQRALNLDALADQVYVVLKRRLAAERRREAI